MVRSLRESIWRSAVVAFLILNMRLLTPSYAQSGVFMQHNDSGRTGAYPTETVLTPANVNVAAFGKLFTRALDATVNGQVLYVSGMTVKGSVHNVIFALTSNNSPNSPCSLYAFDADTPSASAPLWHHVFTNSARWMTCCPVIDPSTSTIFALTKDIDDGGPVRLHAIDLATGFEKNGSPVTVAASVLGSGDGNSGGVVSFVSGQENSRPGLLVLNGVVYIAFSNSNDTIPYHGWLMGYRYDGAQFTQTSVFCTTPNGGDGGIWMAGNGLMADSSGFLYCDVGNGAFDADAGGADYGMCVLKLNTPSLSVADWFAPHDELGYSQSDFDFGNCGVISIPGTTSLFTGITKFSSAFVLDSSLLGGFTPGGPDHVLARIDNLCDHDNVGQNPVSWDAGPDKYIYVWPIGFDIRQFRYNASSGLLDPHGVFVTSSALTSGGSLAVSADGTANGILWAVGNDGVVHALNAADVSRGEFWNSNMNSSRDGIGSVGHFQFPMIANGRVYIPTGSATIAVYGLLNGAGVAAPSCSPPGGSYSSAQLVSITDSTSGAVIHYTTDGTTPTASSPTYQSPIGVSTSLTIKAIAIANGTVSPVSTAAYTITSGDPGPVATPTFNPPAGSYTGTQNVAISDATPGAVIRYTLDGSIPNGSSPVYQNPIAVWHKETITAVASAGGKQSAIASATYNIVATPSISPASGAYPSPISVSISNATPSAVIHYTTDGSTPSAISPTYYGQIRVAKSETITAVAISNGQSSRTASATYTIGSSQGVAGPSFSPPAGTYSSAQLVSITDSTSGAVIHYTTDGTTPTASSPTYKSAINVAKSETIKAIAIANEKTSAVTTAAYTISTTVPQSFSLGDIADAHVVSGIYDNSNYGPSSQVRVSRATNDGNSDANLCAYLMFDLSSVTNPPASAALSLTVNEMSSPSGGSMPINVYGLTDGWNETQITWNNAPQLDRNSFASLAPLIASQTVTLTLGTVTFDVTSFVQANFGKTVTFQLMTPSIGSGLALFNSKEAEKGRPALVITP